MLFVYVLIRLRVHNMSIEGYATVTLHKDNKMTKIIMKGPDCFGSKTTSSSLMCLCV